MTITIRPATAEETALRWAEIAPLVKTATDRTGGCYLPIDVLQQAMAGRVAFWLIESRDPKDDFAGLQSEISAETPQKLGRDPLLVAVAVTELRVYPRKKVIDIPFLAGGRIEEWFATFDDAMVQHAKDCGAVRIDTACGRPGWARFWNARGVPVKVLGCAIVREV